MNVPSNETFLVCLNVKLQKHFKQALGLDLCTGTEIMIVWRISYWKEEPL